MAARKEIGVGASENRRRSRRLVGDEPVAVAEVAKSSSRRKSKTPVGQSATPRKRVSAQKTRWSQRLFRDKVSVDEGEACGKGADDVGGETGGVEDGDVGVGVEVDGDIRGVKEGVDEAVEEGREEGQGQIRGGDVDSPTTCMRYFFLFNMCSEYEDSDCLQELAEDSEGGVECLRRFNARNDMSDPSFAVGMIFESFDVLKRAIRWYSIKNMYLIEIKKNDRQRVRADCADECPWTLYATPYRGGDNVQIRTLVNDHTCVRGFRNKFATYLWIANAYYDVLRLNPDTKVGQLISYIQRDFNIIVERAKVAKARRHVLKLLRGDDKDQYAKLGDYAEELASTNQNTTCILSLDNLVFKKIFICITACKTGFLTGCRPLVYLDGRFLKGQYGGQLLAAVGVDPNDGIWPIAYAVVDVECRKSWSWFLELLEGELGIENSHSVTFMSDRQKGLVQALQDLFPNSEHKYIPPNSWCTTARKAKEEKSKSNG